MKARTVRTKLHVATGAIALALAVTLTACGTDTVSTESVEDEEASAENTEEKAYKELFEEDITENDTAENTADGEHAIEADGTEETYADMKVSKTGDSDGDEADFYGENATIFATNGATLTLDDIYVYSDGAHANGVFSYGEGTTVTISDSLIETEGNCSGGLMTTGGGTTNATNVTIHTAGNSSAAIRSDRGGGTVTVDKSYATTSGTGSPVIYSTADITVSDSYLESTASQGVVVEGSNSVTLENVDLVASNTEKNSDKSDYYQAVMIYQSQSGDAAEGLGTFSMTDGSLTNQNGDIFFITNTVADITLSGVDIVNEDEDGIFLRAATAGWGSDGSNGGQVTLTAQEQTIDGDIVVDDVSTLNFYLTEGSTYDGAINTDGQAGDVYVEIEEGSTWTLTGDSYITGLTCDADAIDLNGYTLYVDGKAYEEGTASEGEAIEITVSESSGDMDGAPQDMGEAPSGDKPEDAGTDEGSESRDSSDSSGSKHSANKSSGDKPSGEPPAKPGENDSDN